MGMATEMNENERGFVIILLFMVFCVLPVMICCGIIVYFFVLIGVRDRPKRVKLKHHRQITFIASEKLKPEEGELYHY